MFTVKITFEGGVRISKSGFATYFEAQQFIDGMITGHGQPVKVIVSIPKKSKDDINKYEEDD